VNNFLLDAIGYYPMRNEGFSSFEDEGMVLIGDCIEEEEYCRRNFLETTLYFKIIDCSKFKESLEE